MIVKPIRRRTERRLLLGWPERAKAGSHCTPLLGRLSSTLSAMLACATVSRDARPHFGMPQMGGGRLCCRLCPHETFRSKSYSRRHSQTSIQDTTDKPRYTRFIDVRSNAFRFGVAARAKIGLMPVDA